MPNLGNRVKNKVIKAAGSSFWIKKIITSSDILNATGTALTSAATGDVALVGYKFMSDTDGIVGPTNFQIIVSGETYGPNVVLANAVSGLISNAALDNESDNNLSTTELVVIEAGDSLQYQGDDAVGTGSGKLVIWLKFERITDNADIKAV